MLDDLLELFAIKPQYDLDIMTRDQTLTQITTRVLTGMEPVLQEAKPDVVLVHGDTTTSSSAALAAFYQQVPVGHVEAGLRTSDRWLPFPEEMNRRVTSVLATLHFAPTQSARDALLREGVDARSIHVTGNTAWVAYVNQGSITDTSGTIEMKWLESAFLEKRAGVWKIGFMHSTRVPQKQ